MTANSIAPISIELVNNAVVQAVVDINIAASPKDRERALVLDYQINRCEQQETCSAQQVLRRDQVFDLPHQIRSQLKAIGLIDDSTDNVHNHTSYLDNVEDVLKAMGRVKDVLGIDSKEGIDLDRFLKDLKE